MTKRYFQAVQMIYNDHFLMLASQLLWQGIKWVLMGNLFPHIHYCFKRSAFGLKGAARLTSMPTVGMISGELWLTFIQNKWPLHFKASASALRCGELGRLSYMAHANSLRSTKNFTSGLVCHYGNQASSILQTKNRRLKQIDILLQSDPICAAIHPGSKGKENMYVLGGSLNNLK